MRMRCIFLFILLSGVFNLKAQNEDSVSNLEEALDQYDSASANESYDSLSEGHVVYSPAQLNETKAYRTETISPKKFDEKKWKKIVGNTNYDEKPLEEKKKTIRKPSVAMPWNSEVLRIVAYVLVIAVVLYVIFLIVRNVSFRFASERASISVDPTGPVENIEELNIQSMLDRALAEGNYKLAVRLYYLALLQKLNEAGLIIWEKEKTNRDYLGELVRREYYHEVRVLTQAYEKVWYGERVVSKTAFQHLASSFELLNQKLNSSKQQ